jgi:hypothetical protein
MRTKEKQYSIESMAMAMEMEMSSNANNSDGGVDNFEDHSTCSNCGHVVPTANLMLHDVNCRRSCLTQEQQSRQQEDRTAPTQLAQSETWQQIFSAQPSSAVVSSNDNSGLISESYDNVVESMTGTVPNTIPSIELAEGQWQCPRCTLINEGCNSNCDACLLPRDDITLPGRPPDATIHERLIPRVESGWVNINHSPEFHGGQTNPTINGRNPVSISQISRIFNGLVNGAMIGAVVGGAGGMLVGGLAGAAGGAMVDRARRNEEENERRETMNVANMLANEGGGIETGTVRVHRGNGHIMALASVGQGQNRLIRVRYGPHIITGTQNDTQLRQRMMDGSMSDLELSLLETLVRMSYARGGTGLGNNMILQPEESFEDLIQRFGLGTENRGASAEVIDSYPVEVVRRVYDSTDQKQSEISVGNKLGKQKMDDRPSQHDASVDLNDASELGTCGICLEDYEEGELTKALSCPSRPHSFHKDCIDKWLKLDASCPICKNNVEMYRPTG